MRGILDFQSRSATAWASDPGAQVSISQPRTPIRLQSLAMVKTIYPSFEAFVAGEVLPLIIEDPTAVRLDGHGHGGNRAVKGRFRWGGRRWRAHSDTRLEPLLLAYWSCRARGAERTFTVMPTGTGCRLGLASDLLDIRKERAQHLYLYRDDD